MAIRLRDRVKQGTVSTGTGTITLSTSFVTFQDFSDVLSDGDTTYYTIENSNDFEVGEGTYSGNTLSRDQVFSSSNTGSLISLAGSSTVFITYPASKSVHLNGSGNVTGIECIDFKLGVTPAYSEGRVFYDNVSHALAVYNDEADITLQVGQEEYLRVRNNSATGILNGQVVRVAGSQGTNPTVELAIATDFDSSNVVGLATHDIENNSFGYVTTFGLVNDVDTSDFAEGSELYLSPLVSGGLTGVAPSAPFYQSPVGVCVRQHPSVGTILVQPKSTKLGGFDVKNLGDIQNSGVPFISEISESSGAILATNTGFYYSVSTDTLNAVNIDVAETINANSVVVEDGGSYKIYNLGQEGDADTEYLETYWDTNVAYIEPKATGSGTTRNLTIGSTSGASVTNIQGATVRLFDNATLMQNIDSSYNTMYNGVRPNFDGTVTLGYDGRRWSNVASVDGDFSGTLSAVTVAGQTDNLTLQSNGGASLISLAEGGSISLTAYSSIYQQFTTFGVGYRENCYPIFATLDMGSAAAPWNNGYFNNLSSAVSGSYKLYNLGTEGDVDTEYLEIAQGDFTGYGIYANATGSGAVNNQIEILTNARKSGPVIKADSVEFYANSSSFAKLAVQNASTYTRQDFRPHTTANYSCGTTTYRWSNVASVDGDFSGTVTVDTINASGSTLDLQLGGSSVLRANSGFSYYYAGGGNTYILQGSDFIRPQGGAAPFDLGGTSHRWRTVFGEDGSFSGNLNVEVGGSFNMYSLGADGDADTESLSIDYDAPGSRWLISSDDPTGTGLSRQLWFDASQIRMYETNTLLWIGESNQMRMYGDIVPSSDGLRNLGISSRKFLGVNAINGDFSGTLTTDFMQSNSGSFSDLQSNTITLSGLPYSDPANSGQIWQSGQYLRISHG